MEPYLSQNRARSEPEVSGIRIGIRIRMGIRMGIRIRMGIGIRISIAFFVCAVEQYTENSGIKKRKTKKQQNNERRITTGSRHFYSTYCIMQSMASNPINRSITASLSLLCHN